MTSSTPGPHQRRRPGYGDYVLASVGYFALGILAIPLFVMSVVFACLIAVWVGIPLLSLTLVAVRTVSMGYRRITARLLGGTVIRPYRVPAGNRFLDRFRTRLTDPTTYRDILWLPVAMSIGFSVGLACMIFLLIFPLGLLLAPFLLKSVAALAAMVLRRPDSEELAARIGELSQTRAEAVDAGAAELRRIERDLHDGAQAHLVALSMNLGLAEQLMDSDPQAGRELIAESRHSASVALTDLRHLVRGIHPPVLSDRGLVGAISALALAQPGSVQVDVDLPGRPPPPVESAMYFAVAEALTNSAKHAAAAATWVWGRYDEGRLRIAVGDNGVGGATITTAGGLNGIERRLAAFDGSVSVASPPGGGTIVSLDLPCELSA